MTYIFLNRVPSSSFLLPSLSRDHSRGIININRRGGINEESGYRSVHMETRFQLVDPVFSSFNRWGGETY